MKIIILKKINVLELIQYKETTFYHDNYGNIKAHLIDNETDFNENSGTLHLNPTDLATLLFDKTVILYDLIITVE